MSKFYFLLTALVVSVSSFSASAGPCQKEADAALSAAGVHNAIFIQRDDLGNSPGKDYFYWYTLPSCSSTGYVNVRLTNACYVQEVFTRWGCNVPGVNHYNF